ncbi:MAG TPA: cupin domain-containing protein [Thermoanaerobaculaceae bacterium]|nr:cupin domain-containing protein [Thermoanaerobaculaceae bacterium]
MGENRGHGRGAGIVIPPQSVSSPPVKRARGARMGVLIGPEQGARNFITRRFVLAPGARIPAHRHPAIEHEQVMVRGEMVLGTGDEVNTVRAGDAMFLPAGSAHWYENRTAEEVEFLCIIPNTPGYETEWLEAPPEGAFSE